MAETTAKGGALAIEVPDFPLGTLIGVEVSYREKIKLSDDEINCLRDLCRVIQQRDMPARREQVIRVWEKRLFDRGYQHLLPLRTGGWRIPGLASGYAAGEQNSRLIFETNIYNSYMQIIVSALTREVPKCRMKPVDPDNDADITAAGKAEKMKPHIARVNRLKSTMADLARFLWTDGQALVVTQYFRDGQQFGFEDEKLEEQEEQTVPETEAEVDKEEKADDAEERATGEGMSEGEEDESGEAEGSSKDGGKLSRQPKGQQVVSVVGALEAKLPIKEDTLASCTYAQVSKEIDLQMARGRYPDHANALRPSGGGPGGDDIDRLARINVRLGVLDNYVTTDSSAYDVTEQITWFRPAALLEIPGQDVVDSLLARQEIRENGLRVIFCGQEFCEARALALDEQLTLIHALPGDGMHRPGIGDWLIPIQKVLNNWLELADDYFVRGVPNTWFDNEIFNVEAFRDQVNVPGAKHGFDREDGVTMQEAIWQEEALQFPQYLWEFIQFFTEELPQLLCGAFPALFGGDQASATDTYGGLMVQRDQALGRLGLAWRNIVEAMARITTQAIKCRARNDEDGTVKLDDEQSTHIEMEDLAGNFLAEPEVDSNFPATWLEKANRMMLVVQEAASNPLYQKLLDSTRNLQTIKSAIGLEDLDLPALVASDKQLGEIVKLLEGAPEPNPQLDQIDKLIAQMQDGERQRMAVAPANGAQPPQPDPQVAARLQQLTQMKSTLPPMVSTVKARWADDDDTELLTCKEWLNSPEGREYANSDEEDEQLGYANVELHAQEHEAASKQKKAQQGPPTGKPPSVSIALKDLPPKEAAEAATMAGIPADAKDFQAEEVAEAATKHPGPGGITA